MVRTIWLAWLVLCGVAWAGEGEPRVTGVATVAPDVLAVSIETGHTLRGRQAPYARQPGDAIDSQGKQFGSRIVKRDGKEIGALVGPKGDILWSFDRLVGTPLDTRWADRTDSYSVASSDDADFAAGVHPAAVWRKSKPTDMLRTGSWRWAFPAIHTVYLKLPGPLKTGRTYAIRFPGGGLPEATYRHDPATIRSEAVHVNQLGFRPDDPLKVGYLSCWLGSGGKLDYREGLAFGVLDAGTGEQAFAGRTVLSKPADKPEDVYQRNYNLVDVHRMDFSELRKPGTYRLAVAGVGCSYPFEIAADVYRRALAVSVRGLYHQRSGIALGPPHTTYRRPRGFHPADGRKVYASTCPLMDSSNGLNARGTDKGNFANLRAGLTDQIVPDAWGGYFDAGDWDRRIQHLYCSRLLLELAGLFGEYFAKLDLNIPESSNDLPDIVDEALWNLDCYRRMQTPEGGIRGGIESAEHPRLGECSWQESLPVMAYAPGIWSSYVYAGDAARAAWCLRTIKPALADVYRASAAKALQYAERHYAPRKDEKLPHAVADARNLAAAELLRLTGEAKYNELFLATTVFGDPKAELFVWQHHEQRDAAFVYATMAGGPADSRVQANARAAILREADMSVKIGQSTGFGWTKTSAYQPVGWGVLGAPQAVGILRAHHLTGEARYLRAAIGACQQSLGANPANLCYTTGLGHASPLHPLVCDAIYGGPGPPPGITVYGPFDTRKYPDHWSVKLFAHVLHPAAQLWPTVEAYIDVPWLIQAAEFTVFQTHAPAGYAWGYLAARK